MNLRGEADARKFRDQFKLTFPVVLDAESALVERFVDGLIPWNAIIDADGVVRYTGVGWNPEPILKALGDAVAAAQKGGPRKGSG